ncbi:MAG TPA: hypothetical protein VGN90_18535 [Pyrinomonadaceae bacterium]|jgi:predicted Na+-dependent transporter|nr:hypothetical protein [Pyrinomonadaceae bacterium]
MSLQTILLVLNAGLFVMVFTFGLNASLYDATYLFRRPGQLARALLAMNVLMPLFAVGLVLIFDLTPVVRFTLVALSVSPVIPVAPLRMLKAGASSASAIGILVAASVLAIVLVPLSMVILGQVFKLPLQMSAASVAVLAFTSVLLPVGLGVAVNSFAPALAERVAKPILLIAVIVTVAFLAGIYFTAASGIWSLVGNSRRHRRICDRRPGDRPLAWWAQTKESPGAGLFDCSPSPRSSNRHRPGKFPRPEPGVRSGALVCVHQHSCFHSVFFVAQALDTTA